MLIHVLMFAPAYSGNCDSMAWQVYAPVEYSAGWNLYAPKTYFFMGVPGSQTPAKVQAFKEKNDSLAQVTIGKVVRREVPNRSDETYSDTWFWWLVKENNKTYLTCYILTYALKGSPMYSYYEIEFTDGERYKWTEPRISLYNFNDMFILLDGTMTVTDYHDHNIQAEEHATDGLKQKMLTTPLYTIKKYDAYQKQNALMDVKYYLTLQYVFNDDEAQQLMHSLQCMEAK